MECTFFFSVFVIARFKFSGDSGFLKYGSTTGSNNKTDSNEIIRQSQPCLFRTAEDWHDKIEITSSTKTN
jgi:hypothetical protein